MGEMQIKAQYHYTLLKMYSIKKTIYSGEDVEEMRFWNSTTGNVNGINTLENLFLKLNITGL